MPDLETSISYCTSCPKLCRHVCPVSHASARETLVPQAKMATLGLLRQRSLEMTAENAEALYGCTGCLACTTACAHGITPGKHLLDGRTAAEREDAGHPALADLPLRVRAVAERAAAEAQAALPERVHAAAKVALLPSCTEPLLACTTMTLLDRIGQHEVALARVSRSCGGYPLWAGGHTTDFRLHAEVLARELAGYERVISACPACVVMMREEYPRRGVRLGPEVMHTVEFLAEVDLPAGPVPQHGRTAFYHDPCYLGRHRGVYDAPRRLLERAGVAVREFSRTREASECAGGGGLLPLTDPAAAQAIAEARLVEVREVQLDPTSAATDTTQATAVSIATACATCKRQLGRSGVEVRDIVELLEEATRS